MKAPGICDHCGGCGGTLKPLHLDSEGFYFCDDCWPKYHDYKPNKKRGGKRKGAGGNKPNLPDHLKRKVDTIGLLPHEWEQLKKIGPSKGKAVSKLLKAEGRSR